MVQNRPSKISIFGASDNKSNNKKLAAILTLTKLCEKTPTVAYNKLITGNRYLNIFDCLNDQRDNVRISTVQFFKAINKLIMQRDPHERKNFFEIIYVRTVQVLNQADGSKHNYFIHGALMMLSLILSESDDLMRERHNEIFAMIVKMSKKKNSMTLSQCIALYPIIVKCSQQITHK